MLWGTVGHGVSSALHPSSLSLQTPVLSLWEAEISWQTSALNSLTAEEMEQS